MDEREPKKENPPTYRAQDARQGEIILKKPWQRWVFGVGLVGGAIVAVLLAILSRTGP